MSVTWIIIVCVKMNFDNSFKKDRAIDTPPPNKCSRMSIDFKFLSSFFQPTQTLKVFSIFFSNAYLKKYSSDFCCNTELSQSKTYLLIGCFQLSLDLISSSDLRMWWLLLASVLKTVLTRVALLLSLTRSIWRQTTATETALPAIKYLPWKTT